MADDTKSWGWLSTRSARAPAAEEEVADLPPLPSPSHIQTGADEEDEVEPEGDDAHIFTTSKDPAAYHSPLLEPIDGDVWSEADEAEHLEHFDDEGSEAGEETSMLHRAPAPKLKTDDELERQDRHVFGGIGRSKEHRGTLGVGEVAWEVAAAWCVHGFGSPRYTMTARAAFPAHRC
jgi:hypothetical protein